jgi:type II secretory pathway component PulM
VKLDWLSALNLSAYLQRLSPRERMLVKGAGAAVLVIGLYVLVYDPLVDLRQRIGNRIVQKQRELEEIQEMRTTYFNLLQQFDLDQAVLAKADPSFSLFSHIESTVAQVVSRDHIASMNPGNKTLGNAYREESVELKLTAVSLKQLVDMMYRIEKGTHQLRVSRMQLKKKPKDPQSFDVTATVSMILPKES